MPKRKKESEEKVKDKKRLKKLKGKRLQIRFEGAATTYTLFRIET